jgi:hypothetical protein
MTDLLNKLFTIESINPIIINLSDRKEYEYLFNEFNFCDDEFSYNNILLQSPAPEP